MASRAATAWRSGSPAISPPGTLASAVETASRPRSAAISNTASVSRFPRPDSRSFPASTSLGSRSLLSIAANVARPQPERPHDIDRGGDQLGVGERACLAEDVHIELKVLPQPSALLPLVAKQLGDREPADRLLERLGVRSHHAGEGGRHLGTERDLAPALVLERVQLLHDL